MVWRHLAMFIGLVLSVVACTVFLLDKSFREKIGIAWAVVVCVVYVAIAFGAVYGRRSPLVRRPLIWLGRNPKAKISIIGLFYMITTIILNIMCSRLSSSFKNYDQLEFSIYLQLSCMCFLLGGLTTVDLGLMDTLTALALNVSLAKSKGFIYSIWIAIPGAARHLILEWGRFNSVEAEKRKKEGADLDFRKMHQQIKIACDRADEALFRTRQCLAMINELSSDPLRQGINMDKFYNAVGAAEMDAEEAHSAEREYIAATTLPQKILAIERAWSTSYMAIDEADGAMSELIGAQHMVLEYFRNTHSSSEETDPTPVELGLPVVPDPPEEVAD